MNTIEVRLLHTACTTGWSDWGHGELWLTPDAVIRTANPALTRRAVRSGARAGATRRVDTTTDAPGGPRIGDDPLHGMAPDPDAAVTLERDVWDAYLTGALRHPRSYAIPRDQITRFAARRGLATEVLRFLLADGTHRKALLTRGAAAARVRAVLAEHLPS